MTGSQRTQLGMFALIVALALGCVFVLRIQGMSSTAGLVTLGAVLILSAIGWGLIASAFWPRIKDSLITMDFPDEIEDDIESIKKLRPTMVSLLTVMAVGGSAIFIQQVLHFRKIEAYWGPIPVTLIAVVCALCVAAALLMTDWYKERYWRTGAKWIWAIVIGFVLSFWLGVFFTEPLEYGAMSRNDKVAATSHQSSSEQPAANDYSRSRTGTFYYSNWYSSGGTSNSSSSSGGGSFKCSGKSCEGIAYALLIALVLILIIASAVIPHFWVVACLLLLTVIWILFIRELLVNEQRRQYSRY